MLYSTLNISTLDGLAAAAREGRLRSLKGMGAKKEAQILKSIEERAKDEGRHLLAETAATAAEIVDYLKGQAPDVEFIPVGSLRRGCETCGDIDIVAVGGDERLMDAFIAHPRVERVLGRGPTKSSVKLSGSYQADLRLVPPESRGAAMQYFTGSKAHNIVVRDRAMQRGFKLNEYGLFRSDTDEKVAGETEEGIYQALGMAWVEPELREHRGEIEAAVAGSLPRLVTVADLRGDLHMHTTATDGRDDLETMAAAAHRLGHQYIAITDHSQALAMANGLDERRALEHAARVRALNGRFEGLTLLAGIECDILPDGRLDLADDCLAQLDLVVASVHSHFTQDQPQMTDRILRALDCPVGGRARPPDRAAAPQARAGGDGHVRDRRCRGGARRGDGDQLSARAARPQRRACAARARARRVIDHFHRRALGEGARSSPMGCPDGATRLGARRGRPQHALVRRLPRQPAQTPDALTWPSPPPASSRSNRSSRDLPTRHPRSPRSGGSTSRPRARRSTTTSPTPSSCSRACRAKKTARRRRSTCRGWPRCSGTGRRRSPKVEKETARRGEPTVEAGL